MGKSIMIQGTMSDVGKSLLTAGLCRCFSNLGYKVAPFKSQNMALNCYVTKDGFQMGKAQAIQAKAARIEPTAKMNPILLKPTGDMGSEVIVNGKSIGLMSAKNYFSYRNTLFPVVTGCYNDLLEQNDIVVIEGAGSPAEINLKKDDIVNMGMAKIAKSPVLLVGDIDRGGVFASLYGTYMLLEDDEKNYIKGMIINKFRGDKSLLTPGISMFREKLDVEILGVLPYLDVNVDQEDSLSKKSFLRKNALLDIAVMDFPKIHNFSDLIIFKKFDFLNMRYIKTFEKIGKTDLVILPDFNIDAFDEIDKVLLKDNLSQLIRENIPIIAFGSGFEILGKSFFKEERIFEGLSLFDFNFNDKESISQREKCSKNTEGFFNFLNFLDLSGFIIKNHDFTAKVIGNILFSNLGGIFENSSFVDSLINELLKAKGISSYTPYVTNDEYIEEQYELLAKGIKENLDINRILQIINEGV